MNQINLSHRYKDIADNIIDINHDYNDKILKIFYKSNPDNIINIIKYLNITDWKNFKFNQYSIRKNDDQYIITLNYQQKNLIKI